MDNFGVAAALVAALVAVSVALEGLLEVTLGQWKEKVRLVAVLIVTAVCVAVAVLAPLDLLTPFIKNALPDFQPGPYWPWAGRILSGFLLARVTQAAHAGVKKVGGI